MSFVVFSLADSCPKETEYCFLEGADPASYDEKRQELCKSPSCQGCFDLCTEVNIFWVYQIFLLPFRYILAASVPGHEEPA